jgi:hypothetical protein
MFIRSTFKKTLKLLSVPFLALAVIEGSVAQEESAPPLWVSALPQSEKHHFLSFINEIARRRSNVDQEIGLDDDQRDEIVKLNEEFSTMKTQLFQQFTNSLDSFGESAEESQRQVLKQQTDSELDRLANQMLVKLDSTLLPHQVKRLKQLAIQRSIQNSTGKNGISMLLSIVEKLELRKSEADVVRESIQKLGNEYEKELETLRKRYGEEILQSLPEHAREKMQKLVGDVFFYEK